MPQQCTYWYFEECPCKSECSDPSWKRAKVSGTSPFAAKFALKLHLTRSSLHNKTDQQAEILADDAEMKSYIGDCEDEEIDKKEDTKIDDTSRSVTPGERNADDRSSSVSSCSRKKRKRKRDDNDMDGLLFDATDKVVHAFECAVVAKSAMLEAKLALEKYKTFRKKGTSRSRD